MILSRVQSTNPKTIILKNNMIKNHEIEKTDNSKRYFNLGLQEKNTNFNKIKNKWAIKKNYLLKEKPKMQRKRKDTYHLVYKL